MPIKSFRGRLADNATETITLHTNNGSTGYKIVKFQVMSEEPYGGGHAEHVVKIYKIPRPNSSFNTVDFEDNTLLAVGIVNNSASGYQYASVPSIIFDNEIFNQDIFITHTDSQGSQACNYYIELEQIKLDLNENTVATLKDIRNIKSQ